MAFIQFDASLHVGNTLIDHEHKVLIDLINGLKDAVDKGNDRQVVERILPGLLEYTKTHFFVEEELMLAYAYPDFNGHKKAHTVFVEKISRLEEDLRTEGSTVPKSILLFLQSWLTDHIMKVDQKLAKFLAENGMR